MSVITAATLGTLIFEYSGELQRHDIDIHNSVVVLLCTAVSYEVAAFG